MNSHHWFLRTNKKAFVAALAVALGCHSATTAQRFTPLGDFPGGDSFSSAADISADGTTIVGGSVKAGSDFDRVFEAFRWTASEGMVGLGELPGGEEYGYAYAVSANGSVIVGASSSAAAGCCSEAFRWTAATGMVGLGDLPGGFAFQSYANDVSANGNLVVGEGSYENAEAVYWQVGWGLEGLGDLSEPHVFSYASGVSADGSIIVGRGVSDRGPEAFRWTAATGMVGLGDLTDQVVFSEARAISDNGLVIVGQGQSASGTEAFRWTAQTGIVGLGTLPGGSFSVAIDVSANGQVVVGQSEKTFYDAFVWTRVGGVQSIAELLSNAGVDMTGWQLFKATGVSADGMIIVGEGANPSGQDEAWRVDITELITVPEPASIALAAMAVLLQLTAARRRTVL